MITRVAFFSTAVCLALIPMARAPIAMATERLPAGEAQTVFLTGRATAIVDGQTFILDQGDRVYLAGINIPPGENDKVIAALKSLIERRLVQLVSVGPQRDRWGRLVAQVMRSDDGLWIQGQLVRDGAVRVAGDGDHRAMLTTLLRLEDQARQDRFGIWASKDFRPRRAAFMPRATGTFEIVEGTVIAAAIVGGRGYLNFGEDRHRDFTIAAEPEVLRAFTKSGIDWQSYQGRQIRVRGHVGFFDGPRIDVTYPEQIEIIETRSAVQPQMPPMENDHVADDPDSSQVERP